MKKQDIINLITERKDIMDFLDTIIDHENGGYMDEEAGEKYVERLIIISDILRSNLPSTASLHDINHREKSAEQLYNECMDQKYIIR